MAHTTNAIVQTSKLIALGDAIRAKAGLANDMTLDEMATAVSNISSGGFSQEDVANNTGTTLEITGTASANNAHIGDPIRFFDFDGTIAFSYSVSELNELAELPDVPTHSGLTSQGWNWTLADIKTLVADTGACDVGAMYTTDDGSTRLYIELQSGRLSPCLGLCPNGTISVDWGDGSTAETMAGTSLTSPKYLTHTYSTAGDYVISVSVTSGSFAIYGSGSYSHILKYSSSSTANANAVYLSSLKKIELGASASVGNYAFYGCVGLESITIPTTVTQLGEGAFWNCYNLNHLTVPTSVTTFGNNLFRLAYRLDTISLPKQLTTIGANMSYDTHSINRIVIPSGVAAIPGNCFYNDLDLAEAYLSDSLTTLSAGGFQSCKSLHKVKMSAGLTTLGSYAFSGCVSLREITLPTGIGTIDSSTFNGCSGLSTITIPSNISVINANAFANCYGLAEIHFKGTTPPTVSATSAFSNLPTDCTIYVPSGCLSAYTSASNYPSSSTYSYVEE